MRWWGPFALVLVLIFGYLSVFVVDERERAIKFQLGRIVRSDYKSGLHFNVPLLQAVRKFDARVRNLDAEPQLYLTSEKKNLEVDSFVKWRIGDVGRYYKATGGDSRVTVDRLTAVIQKRLRDQFGKRSILEVISGERAQIMDIVTRSAQAGAAELGVDIVDVRLKRIDLPEAVMSSVFRRMEAERKEVTKAFRARGKKAAAMIRAEADRKREITLAEADRDAERIRGEGDAEAAAIYARAYRQNVGFYRLHRSLGAYVESFDDRSDILVLEPDTEFFRYFDGPGYGDEPAQAGG